MRKHSLESRLCLLVAGLLFALLLAVGYVQLTGQRAALLESKNDKYQSLSNALALAYTPQTQENGDPIYRALTNRLMKTDPEIRYVAVSDAQKRVIFADSRGDQARDIQFKPGERLADYTDRLNSRNRAARIVHIPTLVGPEERGAVTVCFGSGSVDAAADELKTKLLCTFAVAFLIGMLGAVSLAKTIVHPIRKLITAAGDVASGKLDVSVPISSNDEIGELGSTFNRMTLALKDSQDKLVQRANTDSLTDLYNHRYFQERLSSELSRADRYHRSLSIIMLDIDHFKNLNDTHGHPVGDTTLQQVARILASESRDIDIVSRYGGEEFALILPEATAEDAITLAERLRLVIQRYCFLGNNGETIPVTISLGIAQYPLHSSEREGLIMAADLAMYQAKSMGRNRSVIYDREAQVDTDNDPYKLYLLLHAKDISTIEAMAAAVDAKGQRSQGFSRAVMMHCIAVGQELGLPEKEINDLRIASLLHDIGKLGIPNDILNKPEPLSEEEQRTIKNHPALGYAIVQKSPHLRSMLPGILHHHEWWNGNGYPNCLKGEEIPLIARVIAAVDAYHAMLTERPYHEPVTKEAAMSELRHCAGAQFDPNIVDIFCSILQREESQEAKAA
jgi:diguanylate cyclase (GGDEF)-like protein